MKKLLILLILITTKVSATDPYDFNSPAFSGIGYSAHMLTLEQMKQRNATSVADKKASDLRELERDFENSNVQRFLNNFESRVYAQLSKQLVEELFGEDPQTNGSFDLAGNTIDYISDGVTVTLTITGADGSITTIEIPVGGLGI